MKQTFKQLKSNSNKYLTSTTVNINANNGIYQTTPINLSAFDEATLYVKVSAMGPLDVLQLTKIEFADSTAFSANDNIVTFELNQPYPFGNNSFFPVKSGEYIFYSKEDRKVNPISSAVITKADFDSNKGFAKGEDFIIGIQLNNYPFSKIARFTFTGTSTDGTVAIAIDQLILNCKKNQY